MAPPKKVQRRGVATIRLDHHDQFPAELIDDIVAISDANNADSCREPPTKKPKLAGDAKRSHTIAKEQLVVTRSCDESCSIRGSLTRRDAGSHLELLIVERGEALWLRVSPSARTGRARAETVISLWPESVDKKLETCIRVHCAKEPKDNEGAIWTSVDVRLERSGSTLRLQFDFSLYWNSTTSPFNLRSRRLRELSHQVVSIFFSRNGNAGNEEARDGWTPLDFYEAAHVPPKEDALALSIEIPGMNAVLYPYQKRTLQWLLNREGVSWMQPNNGSPPKIAEVQDADENCIARGFSEASAQDGEKLYLSHLYHAITTDTSAFTTLETSVQGGILAEEMGLGKTLEIIGLILLHKRGMECDGPVIQIAGENLVRSGATLIVCPESLRQQWMTELQQHAPHLLVSYYPGRGSMNGRGDETPDEEELVTHLAHQDVVVTTYTVLSAEIHYATKPPERSRRRERAYPRPKSPLVQISWWRVCLDEAQMIESGVSSAALVARVLHRVNAWGVTGTPVKSDVKDLLGLLLFLRYEPYCSAPQIWSALTAHHKPIFRSLFNDLAIRHTKQQVSDELELPSQQRFVITMPFTAVEEQHYRSLFMQMAEQCGLDIDGHPVVDDWSLNSYEEEMRSWLNRLRQTALHPEVGVQNRRALGHKAGPLRTVDEVLNAMIEQSDVSVRAEQRSYFNARLIRGQMLENGPRVKEALSIWESVEEEIEAIVLNCREELRGVIQEAKQLEAAHIDDTSKEGADGDSEDSDDEAEELLSKGRVGEARNRLRLALEVQHRAVFFCANAHFQIKSNSEFTEPDSDNFRSLQKLEDEGYEQAQNIRREILSENHKKATKLMGRLQKAAAEQNFVTIPEFQPNSLKGLESAPVVERVEELFGLLNLQAEMIDDLREAIVQLLIRPLVDEEDETEITGDEFADSTKVQEYLMAHVQVLRTVIADRQEAVSGLENALVKHELNTAKAAAMAGDGPAPEKFLELLHLRDQVKPSLARHGCLRGAVGDLRALLGRLPKPDQRGEDRVRLEYEITVRQVRDTQAQVQAQTKAIHAMERENDHFTKAMNSRLDYYRQLQAVSDSVAPYEGPTDVQAIANYVRAEESSCKKLMSLEGKHRYLLSLKDTGTASNEPRNCIICQSTFTTGVLTICGHQFCKDCMMLWFKAHHNCPMCKRGLKISELHNITIKPRELKLHADEGTADSAKKHSPTPKKTGIYSEFGSEKLAQINDIELDGPSFTTKVDSIVRHILWLRKSDPGAKSIIFSQYRDFLGVIGTAFSRYRVGYTSIDKARGIQRFKEDATIECFLLHGRAQSSGLNLVNASHVFLCEPLLNTALELQAIARVDRIGQQHDTTVWLYLIEGTVEESIYNLSVQWRMEHMGRGAHVKSKESTPEVLEPTLQAANTLEMEQAALSKLMSKDKSAGEAVEKSDLWECLFGHLAKPIASAAEERDERLDDPAVRRFLAAEAAEDRTRDQA